MKHTFRFKLGIFLLVINMPFGLGGAALCGWLAIWWLVRREQVR